MPTLSLQVVSDNNVRLTIDGHVHYFNPMTEDEEREEANADAIFVLEAGALTPKNNPAQSSGEAYELENGIRRFLKPSSEIWCSRSFKQHLEQRIGDARAGGGGPPDQKAFYLRLAGKLHWLHPQHVIVREGFTLRLLELAQEPLFPARGAGVLITLGEKNLLVASGSACAADYTTSTVPRLELLILDPDVPKEQATRLVAFIQFLNPRKLFLKPHGVGKKLHAELLEQLKARAPEIDVIRQKHFQMTVSGPL